MNQSELRFIEALLIYCLLAESPPISAAEQAEIDARDLTVAREGRRPGLTLVGRRARATACSERGLELLAEVRAVAELLDADAQGYVAAVDAAAEALREPERTPSAALLAALKSEQASFFEYTLDARPHPRGLFSRLRAGRRARAGCSSRRHAGRSRRRKPSQPRIRGRSRPTCGTISRRL